MAMVEKNPEPLDELNRNILEPDNATDNVSANMNEADKSSCSPVSEEGSKSDSENKSDKNGVSRSSSIESEKSEGEISSLPRHQYDRDELIKLSKLSCVKSWPSFLDFSFSNCGIWDPEKWFKSKRRSESPLIEDLRSKRERPSEFERDPSFKRRTPDPKERIKEERDDIVLSPQRRSFGTGCHVSAQTSTFSSRRPNSPTDSRDNDSLHRDSRRIGSGRIVSRDRDRDWEKDHRERDYGYGNNRNRFDRDDRDKDPGRYNTRYRSNDRRLSRGHDRIEEEEEPEWFSGGPTSQHETIELVGFDENSTEDRKSGPRNRRGLKDNSRRQNSVLSQLPPSDRTINNQPLDVTVSQEVIRPNPRSKKAEPPQPTVIEPKEPIEQPPVTSQKKDFDLNDIFKIDFLPGFLPNGAPAESSDFVGLGGSRFSQWFSKEDNPVAEQIAIDQESRRSSLQDEIVSQVIGMGGSQLQAAPASPNYFTSQNKPNRQTKCSGEKNILEILQSANINVTPLLNNENHNSASLKEQARSGKVKSVEELEADLQELVLGNNKRDSEKSAFSKLLNHLSDGSPGNKGMSMGPLDKSRALQEEDIIQSMYKPSSNQSHMMPDLRISPTPPSTNHCTPAAGSLMDLLKDLEKPVVPQPGLPSADMIKEAEHNTMVDLLRNWSDQGPGNSGAQLGDMLSHMMSQQGQQSNHFQSERLGSNFQNKPKQNTLNELLSQNHHQQQARQKFMAPLAGTYSHLLPPSPTPEAACLGIPLPMGAHLSPRQSPLPHDIGPVPPGRIPSPLVFGQQPPVLSHAPAPIHPSQGPLVPTGASSNTLQVQNPAVPRVPSPQELAAHTQSILQNALIKRKLEEQKENFRKRQEAQSRSKSPNVSIASAVNSIPKPATTPVPATASSPSKTYTSAVAAFTPTSVMRKMHSEKQDKDLTRSEGNLIINQGSPDHKMNHLDSSQMNGVSHNSELMVGQRAMTGHMPRALHGQGSAFTNQQHSSYGNQPPQSYNQQVMQQQHQNYTAPRPLTGSGGTQGRPIVKGGQGSEQHARDMGTWAPNKINMAHNKPYMVPNNGGNLLRSEMDPLTRLVEQQRLLNQQQQRHLNSSPMASAGFPRGPPPPVPIPHPNHMRPNMHSANLNLPLLRSMVQANFAHPNVRGPGTSINQLSQFTALQQQQQQAQQQAAQQQRKAMDSNRQMRNFTPLAIQQLLLSGQSQNPPMLPLNNNISMAAGRTAENVFANGMKAGQGLIPPNQSVNRHSPVNLARWFGNDVLKQKMPEMPPVPMQNALSVEELERQHVTIVHN